MKKSMKILKLNLLKIIILGFFLTIILLKIYLQVLHAPEFKKMVCEITINEKENKKLYLEIADTEEEKILRFNE